MSENYKQRTQHLRGTLSEWNSIDNNIIPLEGEIVIEIDEEKSLHKLKIGDGIHPYSELAYLKAGDEIISQVLPRVVRITLEASNWINDPDRSGKYCQYIDLDNITPQSRLDLQPSIDQVDEFKRLGIVFTTENHNTNENNTNQIKICSNIKPTTDYLIQASIVETNIENKNDVVIGVPIIASTSADIKYNPDSENAQSGKAVAEAVEDLKDNIKTINGMSLVGEGDIIVSENGTLDTSTLVSKEELE